ncbi:hypothetical protein BH92_27150 (plasmid) [Rhodococcoides fascians A21d2]|uniref:LppP/LprE family lipoprotein n=1 Tax=Rhodococcoides fascians TaxID=1828 RepID=UPI00055D2D52|nr:LppP/LprE family lipoprotein [Rhodococcus fascians]QII03737.1 hypothetical protein BH92_27150 [Rhodococcus fascians A21d2]
MTIEYDRGMPLGKLMRMTDSFLEPVAIEWLNALGVDAPQPEDLDLDRTRQVVLVEATRVRLKNFYVARFALAVGGQFDYHARASLECAQGYGATYQELATSIHASRQFVQRRYGVRAADREAAEAAIADAVTHLDAPPSGRWSTVAVRHNYDPESELSAAMVTVDHHAAPATSPAHVLLFHHGKFLGTAIDEPLPGTTLLVPACTSTVVAVGFEDTRKSEEPVTLLARFRWLDNRVQWFGDLPPDAASDVANCGYVHYWATESGTAALFSCDNTYVHESHLNGSTVLRVQRPDTAVEYVAGTRYDSGPLTWGSDSGTVVVALEGQILREYPSGTDIRVATRRDLIGETRLR